MSCNSWSIHLVVTCYFDLDQLYIIPAIQEQRRCCSILSIVRLEHELAVHMCHILIEDKVEVNCVDQVGGSLIVLPEDWLRLGWGLQHSHMMLKAITTTGCFSGY